MKLSQKLYLQASVSSVLLCGLMVLFAFASDTVAVAEEPALAAVSELEEQPHGETPLDFPVSEEPSVIPEDSLLSAEQSESEESSEPEEISSGPEGSAEPSSSSSEESASASLPVSSASGPPPAVEIDPSSAASSASSSVSSASSSSQTSSSSSAPSSEPSSESSSQPSSETPSSQPASSAPSEASSSTPSGGTVRMKVNGTVQEMDTYTALCRVVEAEMGGSFHTEALKAQAVAAYSYILYENNRGAAASLPMREPTQKTKDAVAAVLGQAIYFGGSVAFTPYHASSAGWTNPSSEVWGGSYSYLTRVESIHDPSSANRNVTAVFSMSRVKSGLESLLGITLDEADPARWLEVTAVSDSGYVLSVRVTDASGGSHTITGRQVRESVLAYGIRSHAFTVSWNGEAFVFVTNGYGHGVGMSQTGAEGYAQDGWTYQQILNHYYPGTTVR